MPESSEQRYNYLAESLEERNEGFINALCEDIGKLQDCGFTNEQIKKMLGTLSYVKIWCNQPQWLTPVKRLPKGYKWTDGEKLHKKKSNKYDCAETYYLLEIDNDLYIKSFGIAGDSVKKKSNIKIPNWKNVPFRKIDEYCGNCWLRDCLQKKWRDNDLDLGHVNKITKTLGNRQETGRKEQTWRSKMETA